MYKQHAVKESSTNDAQFSRTNVDILVIAIIYVVFKQRHVSAVTFSEREGDIRNKCERLHCPQVTVWCGEGPTQTSGSTGHGPSSQAVALQAQGQPLSH